MKVLKEVKHYSHDDVDGIGSIVMGKHIFLHTSHEYCSYDTIDDKLKEFVLTYMDEGGRIKDHCPYELLLITDIYIKYDTALLLDAFSKNTGVDLLLIDHHKTSTELKDFDWVEVNVEIYGTKTSGTSEIYRLLVDNNELLDERVKDELASFAEQVRLYDTWDWKRYNIPGPNELNNLFYIIGADKFIERFSEDLSTEMTEIDQYLLDIEEDRIQRYINMKEKQMFKTELHGHNVGVVFVEQHHSILGNVICERNDDIDFLVIINIGASKISFRATTDKVDVGTFSKEFYGGGGHPLSAGCEFNPSDRERVFEWIMDKDKLVNHFVNTADINDIANKYLSLLQTQFES